MIRFVRIIPFLLLAATAYASVDFVTYLGGSGYDSIQATALDPADGSVYVAGITNSVNLPDISLPAGRSGLFISKISADGASRIYTKLLLQYSESQPLNPIAYTTALAVDAQGGLYIAGTSTGQGITTTPGAWQRNGSRGFVVKLDRTGALVYGTYLGPGEWELLPSRMQVRDGIAYLAGTVSRPEFFGTAGALQRDLAGRSDLFALALAADGSKPLFLTAFGGSAEEYLADMTLDAQGNIVLAATSSSSDLPRTSNALPFTPGKEAMAILAVIDSTGQKLLYSSALGTASINSVAVTPDGALALAGSSEWAAAGGLQTTIDFPVSRPYGYVAKLSAGAYQPLWSTRLQFTSGFFGRGLAADATGALSWIDYDAVFPSGGSLVPFGRNATLYRLSPDGRQMWLQAALNPLSSATTAAAPDGTVVVAGWIDSIFFGGTYTTDGVLQPKPDPAIFGNGAEGIIHKLHIGEFRLPNFFVPPNSLNFITYRLGEPITDAAGVTVPITFRGAPVPLQTVTTSPRISAAYQDGFLKIAVNPSAASVGTFSEKVTLTAGDARAITLPVEFKVLPRVSFELAQESVEFHIRKGQDPPRPVIGISTSFGDEAFTFEVQKAAELNWIYASVWTPSRNVYQLELSLGDLPPGTYETVLTLKLKNIVNLQRTLRVRYIIDPPAVFQVPSTLPPLRLVQNRPFTPVTFQVTSNPPGVPFTTKLWLGPSWIKVTADSAVTPATVQITADTSFAPLGLSPGLIFVESPGTPRKDINFTYEVASSAPFDFLPKEVKVRWVRPVAAPTNVPNGPSTTISLTAATTTTVEWSFDQPWLLQQLHQGTATTPGYIYLNFDPSIKEGVYRATLQLKGAGQTYTVPVTYELYDIPKLVPSPGWLHFSYRIGDPAPPQQELTLTSPTILPGRFSTVSERYPSVFSFDTPFGSTPAVIKISANVNGLAPGGYAEMLFLQPGFETHSSPVAIPLSLEVLPNPNAPPPTTVRASRLVSGASYLAGVASPGEILVLFGTGLGPSALQSADVGPSGFPTTLAGTRVLFDGVPAPVIYVSAVQLAIVAPFTLSTSGESSVVIEASGQQSAPMTIRTQEFNPALFTANSSGTGIAAALNVAADGSVTPHGANSPVPRGGIVSLFGTGFGRTSPPLVDGALTPAPLPVLTKPVRVLVGGQLADVLYAGPAPGQIGGLTQINVRLPANLSTGSQSVVVVVGDTPSQPGVTLAVQ